jgi:hypothetical protein
MDGGLREVARVPAVRGSSTAIAAVGDGTFWVAWSRGCASPLVRLSARVHGGTVRVTVTAREELGVHVSDIAVTRDGARVALAVRRCGLSPAHSVPELWLRRASGGEATVLVGRPDDGPEAQRVTVDSPAWSPDGRYLAYDTYDEVTIGGGPFGTSALRLYDTQSGAASFLDGRALATATSRGPVECRLRSPSFRRDDLAAVRECSEEFDVVLVDPSSPGGEPTVLFHAPAKHGAWSAGWPRLSFDASGGHAIVDHANIEPPRDVARWDGGPQTVPVTTSQVSHAVW